MPKSSRARVTPGVGDDGDRVQRGLGGEQRRRLGDLQLQPLGGEPGLLQRVGDELAEPVLGQVPGGDVDVHPQVLGPGGGVGAGAVQHPGAELGGEPVVLGGVEEGGRRQQPAGRVLPADQRLVAEQRLVGQVHDRLVEEPQLLVLQRVPQVGLQLQGVDVARGRARPRAPRCGPGCRRPWPWSSALCAWRSRSSGVMSEPRVRPDARRQVDLRARARGTARRGR